MIFKSQMNGKKIQFKFSKVNHKKVTFHNRFGITLVGDLYEPKQKGTGKLAAIAVSGPFGAVKEQSIWPKEDLSL